MENHIIAGTVGESSIATTGAGPEQEQMRNIGDHATMVKWQRFSVPFAYPVAFTRSLFALDNPLLFEMLAMRERDKRHRCLVYLDEGVVTAQPDLPNRVRRYFDAHARHIELVDWVVVPGGEDIKLHPGHVMAMLKAIHRLGIDRHAYVIAIGGGAVLDAVGFAAATAHRGVRHLRVPTTVLSQNDSGVGVKNAINTHGVKNFTGTFAPPWAVLNDFDFLETLPRRERVAGIAEAIKVALIRDGDFYRWLEANAQALARFDQSAEEFMVRRSAELHMHQIAYGGDPFELGSARPLDFGHWSAHKLEALTHHEVHHGEAVAIGIALDARYSALAGLLPEPEAQRIVELLDSLGLATFHPQLLATGPSGELALLAGLQEFREHLGGELTVTLLSGIGQGIEVHDIDMALMAQAIAWLSEREACHALAQ